MREVQDLSSDSLQWKQNSNQYTIVSQVAKTYMCICASTSASECVFCASGHVLSNQRKVVKPEKIDLVLWQNYDFYSSF